MAKASIKRTYFMSDAYMLEKAYYIHSCQTHDLVDFKAFAVKFD